MGEPMTKNNTIRERFDRLYYHPKDWANYEKCWQFIEQELEKARVEAYKQGVADEIECVENSGEHLGLQKTLATNTVENYRCQVIQGLEAEFQDRPDVMKAIKELDDEYLSNLSGKGEK